ncbi:MAG: hypothetical protein ACYDDP_01790 [Acidithiobacillus sp.]
MIIKDKPFHILSAQCVQCAFYYPAAVLGCAVRSFGACDFDHAWRFAGFQRFEAYQVRLSRYLVMRRSDAVFDRVCDAHFDALLEDYLEGGRAGGVR